MEELVEKGQGREILLLLQSWLGCVHRACTEWPGRIWAMMRICGRHFGNCSGVLRKRLKPEKDLILKPG